MAPNIDKEADYIKNKAKKDLLGLLEGVRPSQTSGFGAPCLPSQQVRGKKNLVIGRDLTGLLSLFVQFPTLKEYGVEKVFELENGNTDSTQRNIVYLVHGEKAPLVQAVAGESLSLVAFVYRRQQHAVWTFHHFPTLTTKLEIREIALRKYPISTSPQC